VGHGGFVELRSNLDYARDLVRGGEYLERLQVGAFDVADLYRAAWVQAVSALDHWIHRELYDRALGFALNVDVPRPPKFLTLRIPMSLFEDVHHHSRTLREAFAAHLRDQFGYQSFQAPDKIKEALAHVSEIPLWPAVAKWLTEDTNQPVAPNQVQDMVKQVVARRNRIAHEADRDPEQVSAKQPITAREASATIDGVEQVAVAIIHVIGLPPEASDDVDPDLDGARSSADHAQGSVATGTPTSTGPARVELYRRFWSRFVPIVRRRGWGNAAAPTHNWFTLPAGVGGVTWVVSFSRFGCRSEIYFEHPDPVVNLTRWRVLADQRDAITARFGDGLIFDELPDNKGCRIETRLIGPTIDDEDHWSDVLRWMEDTQLRLRSAIDAVGGVPIVVPRVRTRGR
jgi:Domain of unknown function (DUF4268)